MWSNVLSVSILLLLFFTLFIGVYALHTEVHILLHIYYSYLTLETALLSVVLFAHEDCLLFHVSLGTDNLLC